MQISSNMIPAKKNYYSGIWFSVKEANKINYRKNHVIFTPDYIKFCVDKVKCIL